MVEISDLITVDTVLANLKVTSKKQALQEMAATAAKACELDGRAIFDTLLEREKLGTTGVGRGIAIPHGKLDDLDRIHAVFARLSHPVDFDAIDDEPVDLIFMMLAPTSAGADHLKALARVSRLLRNNGTCGKLRGADDRDAVYALLCEAEDSAAA